MLQIAIWNSTYMRRPGVQTTSCYYSIQELQEKLE